MTDCTYADKEFAAKYAANEPAQFVPGYFAMHQMAAQLLQEKAGDDAEVLVLGAGGGMEIASFGAYAPRWRFTGVDPSGEMLDQARAAIGKENLSDRVEWVCGYIPDAPAGPFDAATCMLTLHFVEDDGRKLDALKAIRGRLRPGAPFVLVDLCLDKSALDYDHRRDRYARFALTSGAAPTDIDRTRTRLKDVLNTVAPERNEALLEEAGFEGHEIFYAGLSWRGWIAHA